MSNIDLLLPYFKESKMAFHLRFHQWGDCSIYQYQVSSTLPTELLHTSYPKLKRKKRVGTKLGVTRAYRLLVKVSVEILENPLLEHFAYPDYLLNDGTIDEDVAKAHLTHLGGYSLEPGEYASTNYQPVFLNTFKQLMLSAYFYYPYLYFMHVSEVTKKDFLDGLPNCSRLEYHKVVEPGMLHQLYVNLKLKVYILSDDELNPLFFAVTSI